MGLGRPLAGPHPHPRLGEVAAGRRALASLTPWSGIWRPRQVHTHGGLQVGCRALGDGRVSCGGRVHDGAGGRGGQPPFLYWARAFASVQVMGRNFPGVEGARPRQWPSA